MCALKTSSHETTNNHIDSDYLVINLHHGSVLSATKCSTTLWRFMEFIVSLYVWEMLVPITVECAVWLNTTMLISLKMIILKVSSCILCGIYWFLIMFGIPYSPDHEYQEICCPRLWRPCSFWPWYAQVNSLVIIDYTFYKFLFYGLIVNKLSKCISESGVSCEINNFNAHSHNIQIMSSLVVAVQTYSFGRK